MISIIIPYHKGEVYLRDCLDSLIDQAYRDFEVLLICDRVPQEELGLLSDYAEELPIRVFHLENKTGVAAARNLGLEKATGEYIYFLDSDDYLYGNTLEILVDAARERDDDITYGKKNPTWFGRSVFIARKQEQELGESEDENEDSTAENAEMNMENGGEDGNNGDSEDTSDDDAEDPSGDKGITEDSEDNEEDNRRSEKSDLEDGDQDGEEQEIALTEEQLENQKMSRIRAAYRILVTKRKGVRNISVLNILFKRSFIEVNQIRFPENLVYFSDIPFLMEALSKTERFKKRMSAKYIKRKHNDAINFPALSQIKDPNRFEEFLNSYYVTIARIPEASDLRNRFDKKYINYYSRVYAPKLKRSKYDSWRNENFIRMSDLVGGMSREVLKNLKGYKKRLIKALIKKKVGKSINIVKVHLGYKKLKKILKNRRALSKFLYTQTFIKKPMKENWILFESFFGKSYSDSPKYVYEYLAKNYPGKYKFIWVIDKRSTKIPFKHKKIKRFGILYSYYLARCGYYVFNGRQPEWVRKRAGNIFLQTWHGTPLKKLVFDIEEVSSATPRYKQQVYKQSRAWDYLIAPNAFSSETFRRCFMFDNRMLETGYPRNDILHSPDRDRISAKVKRKLGIPESKKTILYAPTWRDDEFYAKGQYKFELHLNLEYMRRELGEEYVLLLRTHYFIADSLDVSSLQGFAYNLSKYDDISELYLISDILITDYSSVFFDYANLKRPMLFFTYDLEKYRDVLRGFYFDIEKEVPGPLVYTTEEVVEAVRNVKSIQIEYKQRYENFYGRFCEWEDGHASQKVVESVFSK
ncbi:MAG TPA: CDP-glycerol glycerophosphotransferase family protein [Mobilitalea sp.]|nr:CDP-glycerol glycerophosphotransferase family protein [Mobilitalea sp.]